MMILVINAGSSSLKYQLFDMDHEKVLCKGNCERIGLEKSVIGHKTSDGKQIEKEIAMQNHKDAFMQVNAMLTDDEYGVIKNASEITAVGHRVVQGGARFSKSELVTPEVIEGIRDLIPLAPLHNAGHVQAIEACLEVFGDKIPQVVVFDTAFHSTMTPKEYIYPFQYEYY
ncbi:MAG: hypothetical protein II233_07375 [Clostridia bacterium]|nr:hypothetical protein [Clostridia bacterium]